MQTQTEHELDDIFISATNPRKHVDQEKLKAFAEDVKLRGILQPVLLRQAPDGAPAPFELIFGTRRFKAAKLAKLERIPTRVVEMNDQEVLDAQAAENGQREDVHPLEEAELYELMMKPPKGATWSARTVDEIAAKLGKSRSWIYSRLKLLELTAENRKRFYAGAFDASRALLLARIPNAELQTKAGAEISDDEERGDWSYRDAQQHVVRNYMLRLSDAPFPTGDAQLVPKAGACSTCQKRTGNQAELFADVANADVCTDPACFKEKKLALADRQIEEAKAKQQQVLPAKEIKKAFDNWNGRYEVKWNGDYTKATEKTPASKVIVAKAPDGTIHQLVKKDAPKANTSSSKSSSLPKERKPDPAELARVRGEARVMDELLRNVAAKPTPELWRALIAAYAERYAFTCNDELVRRTLGADKMTPHVVLKGDAKKVAATIAKKLTASGELQALLVGLVFSEAIAEDGIELLEPALKLAGVDHKAIMKKATEEIAAATAPGPKKKPEPKKKGAR
jgi:ParB/RepB/Spo0J family partition protein